MATSACCYVLPCNQQHAALSKCSPPSSLLQERVESQPCEPGAQGRPASRTGQAPRGLAQRTHGLKARQRQRVLPRDGASHGSPVDGCFCASSAAGDPACQHTVVQQAFNLCRVPTAHPLCPLHIQQVVFVYSSCSGVSCRVIELNPQPHASTCHWPIMVHGDATPDAFVSSSALLAQYHRISATGRTGHLQGGRFPAGISEFVALTRQYIQLALRGGKRTETLLCRLH